MRCVIVTPFYPPDRNHATRMYSALAEDLASSGIDVSVVTGQPSYSEAGQVYRKKWSLIESNLEGKVRVIRVIVPKAGRTNIPARIANVLMFNFLAAVSILFFVSADTAIVVNPAMYTCFPSLALRLKGVVIHYRVHDLYPDIGVRLGITRGKAAIHVLEFLETSCYRMAKEVSVVSRGFLPHIISRGIDRGKITVIRDWEDTDAIFPRGKDNPFAIRYGYDSKFVVFYGGNLGRSQGLEFLLDTAAQLSASTNILFLFVGEGALQDELIRRAQELRLSNVRFHPFQPAESLNDVYGAADVGLVSLLPDVSPEWCPAKIYSNMAAGLPILGIVDEGGEAARTIKEAGCGIRIVFGDCEGLMDAIKGLESAPDRCERMGLSGRAYVIAHASRKACVSVLRESLERISA